MSNVGRMFTAASTYTIPAGVIPAGTVIAVGAGGGRAVGVSLSSWLPALRAMVDEMAKPFGITVEVTENFTDDAINLWHCDRQGIGGSDVLLTRRDIEAVRNIDLTFVRARAAWILGIPPYSKGAAVEPPIDPLLVDIAEGRGLADFMEDV